MQTTALLSAADAQVLRLPENVQYSDSGVVSRTLLRTPDTRVILFGFAEGQELTTHSSTRRALVQVLDHSCEFFFAGEWHRLEAGALLHLPPNHPHAVRAAHGPFSMLLTLSAESAS